MIRENVQLQVIEEAELGFYTRNPVDTWPPDGDNLAFGLFGPSMAIGESAVIHVH